jgi:predicted metal-dependent hydrolase
VNATRIVAAAGQPVDAGEHEVMIGGEARRYRLRRSARRTLAITVEPGGDLVVTAPLAASMAQVEAVLQRRREWIRRRTREVAALPPPSPPREWSSGETHRYLGRQYRLRLVSGTPSGVRLSGKWFMVTVPEPREPTQVRDAMQRWYRAHARELFTRRMEALVRTTPLLALTDVPPLIVRRLEKRWGSCSAEGRILMNLDAVKLPVGCVDYLLLHELCHLRAPHHGAAFWRLLDACMPDWERWRKRLDEVEI